MRYNGSGRAHICQPGVKSYGAAKRDEIRARCDAIAEAELGFLVPYTFRRFRSERLQRFFGVVWSFSRR